MTSNAARVSEIRRASFPLRLAHVTALPDVVVLAIAVAIAIAVSRAPLGSGDYGQWLMVSRLYSGDDVPSYRELNGIPPLIPALLGLIRMFVGDPMTALNVLRIVLITSLILGFYLAGNTLFRSRSSALLIAILPVLMTSQVLELFAFGGVLQAASIVFLLLAISAVSRAHRGGEHESRWWVAASACAALAILSHVGSIVVIVPSIVAAGAVVLIGGGIGHWREWPARVAPALAVSALPALYWAVYLGPANRAYATNPASLAYRGPDRLFDPLLNPGLTFALLLIGTVSLGFGTGRCIRRRHVDAYAVVAAWAVASWGVALVTIVAGAATDYPRFTPLLLAPLAVAAGGGVAEFSRFVQTRFTPADMHWLNPAVVIAAGLLVTLGPRQLATFHDRSDGYALHDREGVRTAAAWIDANLPAGQSVLTSSGREGKWIEGLTGEEALFAGPVRYSFRSSEWTRTLAAMSVTRSTTTLVNEVWLGMFTSSAQGEGEAVPSELLVAMNHDGEYLDLVRLPDTEAYVSSGGRILARLANLDPVSVDRVMTDDSVMVRTVRSGVRDGATIGWTREVSLKRGVNELVVHDQVTADVPFDEVIVKVTGREDFALSSVVTEGERATLRFIKAGRRRPVLGLAVPPGTKLTESNDGVVATAVGSHALTLHFSAGTAGDPISGLDLLYPPQVLEDYGVGAALISRGPATPARLERLRALGFSREIQTGDYILMVRENAVGRTEPIRADPETAP